MTIENALVNQTDSDRIEIGELVDRTMNGKFGDVYRAFINGLITECLTYNQDNPTDRMPISADRLLGRAEGYQNSIYGLEQMIQDGNDLKKPVVDEEEEEDENNEN